MLPAAVPGVFVISVCVGTIVIGLEGEERYQMINFFILFALIGVGGVLSVHRLLSQG